MYWLKMPSSCHFGLNKFSCVLSNMQNYRQWKYAKIVVMLHACSTTSHTLLFASVLFVATLLFSFIISFYTIENATKSPLEKIKIISNAFDCLYAIFFSKNHLSIHLSRWCLIASILCFTFTSLIEQSRFMAKILIVSSFVMFGLALIILPGTTF